MSAHVTEFASGVGEPTLNQDQNIDTAMYPSGYDLYNNAELWQPGPNDFPPETLVNSVYGSGDIAGDPSGYSGVVDAQTEDPNGRFLAPHVPLAPYVSIFTIIIRYMSDEGKSFRITSLLLRGRRLIVSVSSEKFPDTCIRISFLISYIPTTKH